MDKVIDLGDWAGFLAAQAGAAATLAGLLFVGVSLNLARILSFPFLAWRALLALFLLVTILVISSLLLVPARTTRTIGFELLLTGGAIWLFGSLVEIEGWRRQTRPQNRVTFLFNVILFEAATVPYLIGGALVLSGDMAGLDWFSVAVVLSFVKAVIDSWVLLVEVNR